MNEEREKDSEAVSSDDWTHFVPYMIMYLKGIIKWLNIGRQF